MMPPSIAFCEGLSPQNLVELDLSALEQLQSLFNQSTFWAKDRTLEDLEMAIACSNPVMSVWDEATLIGFARATSDGVYRAAIWDVVIHPHYRGMGLGQQLMKHLLHHPLMARVERIYLTTTYQQAFYKKLGFEENSTATMIRTQSRLDAKTSDAIHHRITQPLK